MAFYKAICLLTTAVLCAQAQVNSRILRAVPAARGASTMRAAPIVRAGVWSRVVSLQKNGSHVCGGTLVAMNFVLSNANCFSSSPRPSDWTVVLSGLTQNGSTPSEVTVTNITLSSLTGSNVAVLQLATPPTLSSYIQPICLDNGQTFSVGSTCWAAGWRSGQGGVDQVLQQIQTSVVNCGKTSSDSICTGAFPLKQGDSGGPLMCEQDGSLCQAAVLTADNISTRQTRVGFTVFKRVSHFQSFLLQTVGTV